MPVEVDSECNPVRGWLQRMLLYNDAVQLVLASNSRGEEGRIRDEDEGAGEGDCQVGRGEEGAIWEDRAGDGEGKEHLRHTRSRDNVHLLRICGETQLPL